MFAREIDSPIGALQPLPPPPPKKKKKKTPQKKKKKIF